MNFEDFFKPYSLELRGDLLAYLRESQRSDVDNLFFGSEHYWEIRDNGLMVPRVTYVRVDQSPIPDIRYFVNSDFLLQSRGPGHQNMSLMGAQEGVYHPNEALKDRRWSISGLNLRE